MFYVARKRITDMTESLKCCVPHTERHDELCPRRELKATHVDEFTCFIQSNRFAPNVVCCPPRFSTAVDSTGEAVVVSLRDNIAQSP